MALSLFVLASIALASLWCCQAHLIHDVCIRSLDPSSCAQTLSSDPHSRGAGLQDLGKIGVEKAISATRDAISVARSVRGSKNAKSIYHCVTELRYICHY